MTKAACRTGECVYWEILTIVGEETEVVVVAVVPRKQEHALETREAGKDVTPVGKRSSSWSSRSACSNQIAGFVTV